MDGPEGSCHRLNLRTPDTGMLLDYTFADHKDYTTYRPHRTFYGYRFVSITADQEVRIRSIQSIPVSSITQQMETGSITTGNKLVNQLISNTLWGQRSNYLSVPTDCPQRNERLGWTADTQVFAETGTSWPIPLISSINGCVICVTHNHQPVRIPVSLHWLNTVRLLLI